MGGAFTGDARRPQVPLPAGLTFAFRDVSPALRLEQLTLGAITPGDECYTIPVLEACSETMPHLAIKFDASTTGSCEDPPPMLTFADGVASGVLRRRRHLESRGPPQPQPYRASAADTGHPTPTRVARRRAYRHGGRAVHALPAIWQTSRTLSLAARSLSWCPTLGSSCRPITRSWPRRRILGARRWR